MAQQTLYKLLREKEWTQFQMNKVFTGSADDIRDGFIHFSYAAQVAQTARKYFRHEPGLVLLAVSPAGLGDALRGETSRNGEKFPHLYATLGLDQVRTVHALPLDADGVPVIPPLEEENA